MSTAFRFTPASISAFKHTARDIKKAYGNLPLQACQELLARIYGYPDLHAVQEHMKTNPQPGPYPTELPFGDAIELRMSAFTRFSEFAPDDARPTGRRDIDDLGIFEEPDVRKGVIAQEDFQDAVSTGAIAAEHEAQVSDYAWFEVREEFSRRPKKKPSMEGVFRLTAKGHSVYRVILDQMEVVKSDHYSDEERQAACDVLSAAALQMPKNPYLLAWQLVNSMAQLSEDGGLEFDPRAESLWHQFKACRSMFEGLMPKGFKGKIEPQLVGNNASSGAYFDVLYWGARCAAIAGHKPHALTWARRSVRLSARDVLGARFLVRRLEE
ncbi:hypothetical protein ACSFA0_23415 [Variovorax sp. LT1P1]|uniref:hypothetical protein n=1 Tax=Variovorax sp. LT1P1 TaxID=3443730 RepID=UPI003F47B16E